MRDWLTDRPLFLQKLLEAEAPRSDGKCSKCKRANGSWRCKDCYGNPTYCQPCLQDQHILDPFHRVEVWSGTHFQRTALHKADICLQLGHQGDLCPYYSRSIDEPNPFHPPHYDDQRGDADDVVDDTPAEEATREAESAGLEFDDLDTPKGVDVDGSPWITIIHTTGVHFLKAKFCQCPNSAPRRVQMLEASLYPATKRRPRTVFTFQVLDDFYLENLECKTPARNFYSKIRRLTSNVFPHVVPVGFAIFRTRVKLTSPNKF